MSTSKASPPRTWPSLLALPASRRGRILLVCLAAAVLAIACAWLWRKPLLRSAGWALVATDPVQRADLIVISVDADGAGVLEAADLVKAGIAARVAVFADPPDAVDQEFIRRRLRYYDAAAVSVQQLHELDVERAEVIPRPVSGTSDEVRVLPAWCVRQGLHTVVFIATADHTRRTRRELARTMRGSGVTLIVRASRYSQFDPDSWWRSRHGIRTEVLESQKLLLDLLQHPLG
jgi:hypothetical protein